jgi:HEAT repeat protein
VFAAGPRNQKAAVEYLFKVSTRLPKLNLEKLIELAGEETELKDLLKQLILNDELAIQFAERLKNGTSSDRSLVTCYLLMVGSMGLVNDKDPKFVELNAWYQKHSELFFSAFEAASKDENEEVRWFAIGALARRDPQLVSILSTLTAAIESDSSTRVRSMAIDLLTRNDVKSVAKSQNIELAPILVKTLESDTSIDVRYSALGALMELDAASELVHATLLEWARCKERLQVEYAITLILRNHEAGDRPQSIDELIELLSDPEWGTTVGVKQYNYRWARQYAIAVLGQYAEHAHRALPTLEAELARNNKDTLSFTTEAIDSVRGYCPDRPIDQLQGQWEFVSVNRLSSSTPFFDFPLHPGGVYPGMGREIRTASPELPPSIINVSGTQLKLGGRVLAEISHQRQNLEIVMLLDPDGKKRHCNGRYEFKGGPSPEYKPNATPNPELLILEVCELQDDSGATQVTKQTFEFRPVNK